MSDVAAALITAFASGDTAVVERCATEECRRLVGGVVADRPTLTLGQEQPLPGGGTLVRLDLRADEVVSIWLRLATDGRIEAVAGMSSDVAALLPAGTTFQVEPWATAAAASPTGRCAPRAVAACAELAAELQGKGATLRPLVTYTTGDRHVALVDFVVAGEALDRLWLYATGGPEDARLSDTDEDEAHAAAFLAGELPADRSVPLPLAPALETVGRGLCGGNEPLPPVLRGQDLAGCEVVSSGALGTWGAVCLRTRGGGALVVRVRQVSGMWVPSGYAYDLDCALTLSDATP